MISGSISQLEVFEQYSGLQSNIVDILHTVGFAVSDEDAHQLTNSVLYHLLGEKTYFDYVNIIRFPMDKSHLN